MKVTIPISCFIIVSNVSWKAMEQSQHPFSVHIGIIDNIDSWTSLCDDSWTPFVRSLPQVYMNT